MLKLLWKYLNCCLTVSIFSLNSGKKTLKFTLHKSYNIINMSSYKNEYDTYRNQKYQHQFVPQSHSRREGYLMATLHSNSDSYIAPTWVLSYFNLLTLYIYYCL